MQEKRFEKIKTLLQEQKYEEILNASLGLTPVKSDLTKKAYESKDIYLLARSYKSNKASGIDAELSFLENRNGQIYFNPTTVISHRIPSRTISQSLDSEWTDQPSLLFTVDPTSRTTIADHGIGALNSFNSTDALLLLDEITSNESKLTLSEKLLCLKDFLTHHWHSTIVEIRNAIEELTGSELSIRANTNKTFYKSFNLFYHKKEEYDLFTNSLQELARQLETAYQLSEVTDTPIDKDIAKILTNWLPRKVGLSDKDQILRAKTLLLGISQYLKDNIKNNSTIPEKEIEKIYEKYCEFLDTGARHNELLSRVYIWEITGIEWGGNQEQKENAISDLITLTKARQQLRQELKSQGIEHPLFKDFMLNKLSLGHPSLHIRDLERKYLAEKTQKSSQFDETLFEMIRKLNDPIYIYEYSCTKNKLTNISEKIYREKNSEYQKIIQNGIELHTKKYGNKIVISPRSVVKKLDLLIDVTPYKKYKSFWQERDSDKQFIEIFKIIAETILKQPYLDEPRELVDSRNRVLYRPNHDVTHAIRKVLYSNYLLHLLDEEGRDSFTPEEITAIRLAVFLSRAGRTNEKEWDKDPTYDERSANIFAAIAKELGFNKNLISTIQKIMCHQKVDLTQTSLTKSKLELILFVLEISHDTDLIRCNSWRTYFSDEAHLIQAKEKSAHIKNFQFSMLHKIKMLFGEMRATEIQQQLITLAKDACELTGSPVRFDGFSAKEKVEDYEQPLKESRVKGYLPPHIKDLKLKDIKSFCTHHIPICFAMLQQLKIDFIKEHAKKQQLHAKI